MPDLKQVLTSRALKAAPDSNLDLSPLQSIFESQTADRMGRAMDPHAVDINGDAMLLPPTPGMFRPDATVNNPEVARLLHQIIKQVPQVRNTLGNNVTVGPNADTVDELRHSKYNVFDYPKLNLLGTTNTRNHNISINPRLVDNNDSFRAALLETLTHELTHTAGYGESDASETGELVAAKNKKAYLPK